MLLLSSVFPGTAICKHVDGQLGAPGGRGRGWEGRAAPWELGWSDLCLSVLWEDAAHVRPQAVTSDGLTEAD